MVKWLLIAVLLGVVLLLWRITVYSSRHLPRVGDMAPGFSLLDQNGKAHTLEAFRGRWLVLYFYPRDDTPGCTEQAACYRDAMLDLEGLGVVVCGVSVDDAESHAAFALKYKLPFTLLSDRDGETVARYGSLLNLGFFKFAKRNTFLIDPQDKVAAVYLGVNPSRDAKDATADLKRLAGK